jgi:hypothetical protein
MRAKIKKQKKLVAVAGALLLTLGLAAAGKKIAEKPTAQQLNAAHNAIMTETNFITYLNAKMVPVKPHATFIKPGSGKVGDYNSVIRQPIDEETGSITLPLLFINPPENKHQEFVLEKFKENLQKQLQRILDDKSVGLKVSEVKLKQLEYDLYFPEKMYPESKSPFHRKATEVEVKMRKQFFYRPRSKI